MNGVNYALPEKDAEMQAYVDKLESISRKLSAFGKSLVVYTTPSKAHYHRENIPDKYLLQAVSGKRGIDAFREKIARTGIPFLDTNFVAEKIACPVFYKTGIHWSRPVEQASSVELINLMNNVRGANFRELLLGEIKEQSSPFWKDMDVFDLLNLYLPAEECTYYEYGTNRTYPSEFDKLRVLLQGGSFSSGLQHDYFGAYAGDEVHAIFYDESIEYDGGYIKPLNGWDELDLQPLLDQTDIVLIELNEAVVSAYSSGFVEYLDNFLDSYSPSESSVRYADQRLIPAQKTGLAYSDGFYEYENGIVWATAEWPSIIGHAYSVILIIIGWVLFRADGLRNGLTYLRNMFRFEAGMWDQVVILMTNQHWFCLVAGIIFTLPVVPKLEELFKNTHLHAMVDVVAEVGIVVMFIIAIAYLLGKGFSPFLYFRF